MSEEIKTINTTASSFFDPEDRIQALEQQVVEMNRELLAVTRENSDLLDEIKGLQNRLDQGGHPTEVFEEIDALKHRLSESLLELENKLDKKSSFEGSGSGASQKDVQKALDLFQASQAQHLNTILSRIESLEEDEKAGGMGLDLSVVKSIESKIEGRVKEALQELREELTGVVFHEDLGRIRKDLARLLQESLSNISLESIKEVLQEETQGFLKREDVLAELSDYAPAEVGVSEDVVVGLEQKLLERIDSLEQALKEEQAKRELASTSLQESFESRLLETESSFEQRVQLVAADLQEQSQTLMEAIKSEAHPASTFEEEGDEVELPSFLEEDVFERSEPEPEPEPELEKKEVVEESFEGARRESLNGVVTDLPKQGAHCPYSLRDVFNVVRENKGQALRLLVGKNPEVLLSGQWCPVGDYVLKSEDVWWLTLCSLKAQDRVKLENLGEIESEFFWKGQEFAFKGLVKDQKLRALWRIKSELPVKEVYTLQSLSMSMEIGQLLERENGMVLVGVWPETRWGKVLSALVEHVSQRMRKRITILSEYKNFETYSQASEIIEHRIDNGEISNLKEGLERVTAEAPDVCVVNYLEPKSSYMPLLQLSESSCLTIVLVEAKNIPKTLLRFVQSFQVEDRAKVVSKLARVLVGVLCHRPFLDNNMGWYESELMTKNYELAELMNKGRLKVLSNRIRARRDPGCFDYHFDRQRLLSLAEILPENASPVETEPEEEVFDADEDGPLLSWL